MGSDSDWNQMQECCYLLDQLAISYDKAVVSASYAKWDDESR